MMTTIEYCPYPAFGPEEAGRCAVGGKHISIWYPEPWVLAHELVHACQWQAGRSTSRGIEEEARRIAPLWGKRYESRLQEILDAIVGGESVELDISGLAPVFLQDR